MTGAERREYARQQQLARYDGETDSRWGAEVRQALALGTEFEENEEVCDGTPEHQP